MDNVTTKNVFPVLFGIILAACSLTFHPRNSTLTDSQSAPGSPGNVVLRTPTANRAATIDARHTLAAALPSAQSPTSAAPAAVPASPLPLTPSGTPEPTPTNTPTPDFSEFAHQWTRYTSQEHGISFEYPAVFDVTPYKEMGCGVRIYTHAAEVYFDVGERIILTVFKVPDKTLAQYVDEFVRHSASQDLTITSRTESTVGGVKAVILEYRFGALNRYGVVTYFKRGDNMYAADFTAGLFCEMAAGDTTSGMSEFDAYFHILDSFRFTG